MLTELAPLPPSRCGRHTKPALDNAWVHPSQSAPIWLPGPSLFLEHILVQSLDLSLSVSGPSGSGLIPTPLSRKPAPCLNLGCWFGHFPGCQGRGSHLQPLPSRTCQWCRPAPHLSSTISRSGQENSDHRAQANIHIHIHTHTSFDCLSLPITWLKLHF